MRPSGLVVCLPQPRQRRLASPNTAERERGGHAWKIRVRKRRARGKVAVRRRLQHHPSDLACPPHFPHPLACSQPGATSRKNRAAQKQRGETGTGGQSIPAIHAQPGPPIERGIATSRDAAVLPGGAGLSRRSDCSAAVPRRAPLPHRQRSRF